MSNSSRTPVPSAVISAWISGFCRTLSIRAFSTLRILPRSGSTACVERSRPCLAEPPAESPSTMNNSASDGFLTVQSAGTPGGAGLADDRAGLLRVLLEELGELGVDHGGDEALHAGVTELGLGLAL